MNLGDGPTAAELDVTSSRAHVIAPHLSSGDIPEHSPTRGYGPQTTRDHGVLYIRKLIATVFNYSFDGLLADEGTESWKCRSEPRADPARLQPHGGVVRLRSRLAGWDGAVGGQPPAPVGELLPQSSPQREDDGAQRRRRLRRRVGRRRGGRVRGRVLRVADRWDDPGVHGDVREGLYGRGLGADSCRREAVSRSTEEVRAPVAAPRETRCGWFARVGSSGK